MAVAELAVGTTNTMLCMGPVTAPRPAGGVAVLQAWGNTMGMPTSGGTPAAGMAQVGTTPVWASQLGSLGMYDPFSVMFCPA